jgi:hypothetical protein
MPAPNPLDLEGVSFNDGITHTFTPFMLGPGARLVLAKNPTALATRHATDAIHLIPWTSGNLARSGETLSLTAPGGGNILTFTYSRDWHPETHNTGASLVAIDLAAPEPLWSTADNWRPSRVMFGTPVSRVTRIGQSSRHHRRISARGFGGAGGQRRTLVLR